MTQPDLATWLKRKPAGPKPKRPLPRVTKKRAKQLREYSIRSKAFLIRHPYCQAFMEDRGHKEDEVKMHGGFAPGGFGQVPFSTEVHHREGRIGEKLLDESTWMAVCNDVHMWIHANPSAARAKGWLK